MALQKQIVNVEFKQGVDTKSTDVATVPGSLLLLQNGQFDKVGTINKRLPFPLLSNNALSQNSIPNTVKLLPLKDSLNLITERQTYASSFGARPGSPNELLHYDETKNAFTRNTAVHSAIIQHFSVVGDVGDAGTYQVLDSISVGALTYHLIKFDQILANAVYFFVTDSADESIVVYSSVLTSASTVIVTCGRLVANGTTIYGFINSSATTNLSTFSFSGGNQPVPSPMTLTSFVTDLGTNKDFDVAINSATGKMYVSYNSSTLNTVKIKSTTNATSIIDAVSIAQNALRCISLAWVSTSSQLIVVFVNTANDLYIARYDSVLGVVLAATTFLTEGANVLNICIDGNLFDGIGSTVPLIWTLSAAAATEYKIKGIEVGTTTGVYPPNRIICRSLSIASKIAYLNGKHYVFALYKSETQSTNYLMHLAGIDTDYARVIVGRFFAGQARLNNTYISPPSAPSIGNTLRFAGIANRFFKALSYTPQYGNGVSEVVVYLTDPRNFSNVEAANCAQIIGGCMSVYDGLTSTELGFNNFPETPTVAQAAGGALTLLGAYAYSIVYEWTDRFGQTHKSAPSFAASITLTGGNQSVNLVIPCYRVTNKTIDVGTTTTSGLVLAKIFRTAASGSNFQEVSKILVPYNTDTVTYNDTMSDATLASQAFIYTTGGVLENIAPYPSWAGVNWKERVCLVTEEGIQYSKKRVDGVPVEFSDAFIIQLETAGGRGTGIAILDDKLIIFKKDRLYYVTGDGPNDTGTFGVFSNPIAIQSDVGCINPKSIVSTDNGVMFQASKGIYMLLRNLTLVYIGAPLDYFLESQPTITSTLLVETENQVRFLTAANECFVYDYLLNQWSVFTNHAGQDLALFNDYVVRVNSSSKVVIETPNTTFGDYDSASLTDYSLKIRTGWLSFADVQGFMRVYRFLLLGKFKSHHILTVKVAYDYNPKVIDTYSFDTQGSGKSLTVIPDAALYASTAFSGTDIYQFRGHLSKQKCEALQLTIEDTSLAGTKESFGLTNIAFEVGIKTAVFKKPAAFSNG